MNTYRLTLQPLSAFGTPLAGDTLFGQLCWALRHLLGNAALTQLLDGYTAGRPFAVISDGLPAGHLPLPTLPSRRWADCDLDRKALKRRRWLPTAALTEPLPGWQALARDDAAAAHAITGRPGVLQAERAQPHNTLNRQTGSTGTGAFAPYTQAQLWFAPGMQFDLYVALDEARLPLAGLLAALTHIGHTGFGRDASIGLGKFALVGSPLAAPFGGRPAGNAWLSLGPCAPQGQGFCPRRSYYQALTRFGRHGDMAVHGASPFKRPLLLARAGGLFVPLAPGGPAPFIGQGLGGPAAPVSPAMPETVHQGYAPVLGLHLPETR